MTYPPSLGPGPTADNTNGPTTTMIGPGRQINRVTHIKQRAQHRLSVWCLAGRTDAHTHTCPGQPGTDQVTVRSE